jgi:hypothetical protein
MHTKPTAGIDAVESTLDRYKDSLNGRPDERQLVEDMLQDAKQHAHRAKFQQSTELWVAALLGIMIEDEKERRGLKERQH